LAAHVPSLGTSLHARRRIWPLAQRLAHWLLAAATLTALVSGLWLPEWMLPLHLLAGIAAGLVVLFRLVAGLLGPPPLAFRTLPLSTEALRRHLALLRHLRPPPHLAHNPLGSLMVVALLTTVGLLVLTGVVVWGGQEKAGPFAAFVGYDLAAALRPLHRLLGWTVLVLIVGHVLGVLVESRLARESLVIAMITGRKRVDAAAVDAGLLLQADPVACRRAVVTGLAVAGAVLLGGVALATLPPRGVFDIRYPQVYLDECGACHDAHHPSLLPPESWARLLTGLDDHFGEDASLDDATAREIRRFLEETAALPWDTEAAREIRATLPDGPDPPRITASTWWRMRHGWIEEGMFRHPRVGGRLNCGACHADAATGLFADAAIRLPTDP